MEEHTLSITIGSGDIRHNNRLFKPSNVDHSRTPDNITLVRENIQDAYHNLFNESVIKYNENQKRDDRKIKNYFDKIYRSKKEKPFYEFIAQVGNQGVQPDQKKCVEILEDFHKMMQKDYPNMKIFNSVIHVDESTPHLHLDFIPVGEGYKKGLEKRVSMQKALQNLGFSNYADFRNELMQKFEIIAKRHKIERKRDVAVGERHLTIQDYRALNRMAEQKIEDLDKTRVPRSSSRVLKKLNVVPVEMYEEVSRDNMYRKAQNKALTSENENLRTQLINLKTENNIDTYEAVIESQKSKIESLNDEIDEIRYNFNTMQKSNDSRIEKMYEKNDALQEQIEALEKSSAALKVQISDKEKTIENLKNQSKQLEKMGQILTENENLKNDVKKLDEKVKKTEQKLVQNSSETRQKLVKTEQENRKLEGQISSLKSENETLQNECKELNTEINDMKVNSHRQERFIDAMKKCSRTNDMPRMANIAKLMANEQYDDLDEELDECLRRLRTARMRQ